MRFRFFRIFSFWSWYRLSRFVLTLASIVILFSEFRFSFFCTWKLVLEQLPRLVLTPFRFWFEFRKSSFHFFLFFFRFFLFLFIYIEVSVEATISLSFFDRLSIIIRVSKIFWFLFFPIFLWLLVWTSIGIFLNEARAIGSPCNTFFRVRQIWETPASCSRYPHVYNHTPLPASGLLDIDAPDSHWEVVMAEKAALWLEIYNKLPFLSGCPGCGQKKGCTYSAAKLHGAVVYGMQYKNFTGALCVAPSVRKQTNKARTSHTRGPSCYFLFSFALPLDGWGNHTFLYCLLLTCTTHNTSR